MVFSSTILQNHCAEDPVATALLVFVDDICRNGKLTAEYLFHVACGAEKDILLELFAEDLPGERKDAINALSSGAITVLDCSSGCSRDYPRDLVEFSRFSSAVYTDPLWDLHSQSTQFSQSIQAPHARYDFVTGRPADSGL